MEHTAKPSWAAHIRKGVLNACDFVSPAVVQVDLCFLRMYNIRKQIVKRRGENQTTSGKQQSCMTAVDTGKVRGCSFKREELGIHAWSTTSPHLY